MALSNKKYWQSQEKLNDSSMLIIAFHLYCINIYLKLELAATRFEIELCMAKDDS